MLIKSILKVHLVSGFLYEKNLNEIILELTLKVDAKSFWLLFYYLF